MKRVITLLGLLIAVSTMPVYAAAPRQDAASPQGGAWTWGDNQSGQLGGGIARTVPGAVSGGRTDYVGIATGFAHTLARRADGTVWAWGDNWCGMLGNGRSGVGESEPRPVQVHGPNGFGMLSGVRSIASGSTARTTLALLANGTAYQWGARTYNNLQECDSVPRLVHDASMQPVSGIIALSAGDVHNLLLKQDGTVWAWGTNGSGQFGDGTDQPSTTPIQVQDLDNVVGIAAGGSHSLALKSDGTVWAWGLGSDGQLGDGTQSLGRRRPSQVLGAEGEGVLTGIVAIAAGRDHSLALREDGTVWAWGNDTFGQIGGADNRILPNLTPTAVQRPDGGGMLAGITAIAGGNDHSLAIGYAGTVWGWGKNIHGELGNGSEESSRRPVQTSNLRWTFMVAAGNRHSAALTSANINRVQLPLITR